MKKYLILCCIAFLQFAPTRSQTFNVDFAQWIDNPLVKGKFDVYQTPLIQSSRLFKHCPRLNELGIQNLRYEIGWGKSCELNYPQIKGTSPDFIYNFTDFDRFIDSLSKYNVKPLLAMCYTPQPIKVDNSETKMFTDLGGWQKINRDYASHFKTKAGKSSAMYEIWNEPDFNLFFQGNLQDYKNIYRYAAKGLREGDPEAIIGGPALAWTTNWLDTLLNMTQVENIPIDFLSGHSYGQPEWVANYLRTALSHYPNPKLPLVVSEYGSYTTNGSMCLGAGCDQERYMSAMWFFRDVNKFLTYSDVTNVYWAQWTDVEYTNNGTNWFPGSDNLGLLTLDNHQKALFNAFKIYYQMPVDRCKAIPTSLHDMNIMASVDPNNAGVIIWNTSTDTERSAVINLANIPFASGSLEVYRIDAINGSYIDRLPSEKLKISTGESKTLTGINDQWSGKIPAQGVVYLKLKNTASNRSLLEPSKIGLFNRHQYWFSDRNASAYANFDKITSIARLGTGASGTGYGTIGAQFDSIVSDLHIQVKKGGDFKIIDKNSVFGIRFDYYNGSAYTKSLFVHGGIYNSERTTAYPFGTKSAPDDVLYTEAFNNNEDFTIDLKNYAPDDWSGRVLVTFEIQNTGTLTRAAIYLGDKPRDLGTDIKTPQIGNTGNNTLKIYPNPVNNCDFQIDLTGISSKPLSISIFDYLGQQQFLKEAEFNDVLNFHSNQFQKGVYLVVANSGTTSVCQKLVIN